MPGSLILSAISWTIPAASLLALASCGAPDPAAETSRLLPPDPLDSEMAAMAQSLGGPAAGALAGGLVGRLSEALQEGGAAGAMEFCSTEAIPLTMALSQEHAPGFEVKRTSLRIRNPGNAPDAWEERILRYVEAMEAEERGSAPETITAAGPDGSFRFYRTLRTVPMCLQCHGAEDALSPGVQEILHARYPDDRATGYETGDFRGLLRVEIPADYEGVAPAGS